MVCKAHGIGLWHCLQAGQARMRVVMAIRQRFVEGDDTK